MRVTHSMQFNVALSNIQKQNTRLLRAQEEAATGKKVLRPADDPTATHRILDIRLELAASASLQKNRDVITTSLGVTENALQGIETAVLRAQEIAISGASDNLNLQDRAILAQEVGHLFDQVVELGNTHLAGRFIFAGHAASQAPFTPDGLFVGESSEINLPIDMQQTLGLNMTGAQFLASDLRPALDPTTPLSSLYRGQGVNLDSLQITDRVGNTALIDLSAATSVNDVLNAISGAAGVNVTASINATGTGLIIIDDNPMPIQNLHLTDVSGGSTASELGIAADRPGPVEGASLQPAVTVSTPLSALYGGQGMDPSVIHIANGTSEADVDLRGSLTIGDVLSAINGSGANVTASLNGNGTALDVRSNDPTTVAVVTDVNGGTSAADLGIQGARDILKTLQHLRQALELNDRQSIGNLLPHLSAGLEQLLALRGEVGARLRRLEFVDTQRTDLDLTLTSALSKTEDADAAAAFLRLSHMSTAFEAALASAARTVRPTLLDFLR